MRDARGTARGKRHAVAVDATGEEFVRTWLVNTNPAHGGDRGVIAELGDGDFGHVDVRFARLVDLLEHGWLDRDRLGAISVGSTEFSRRKGLVADAAAIPIGGGIEVPLDTRFEVRAAVRADGPVRGRTTDASRCGTCTWSTRKWWGIGNTVPRGGAFGTRFEVDVEARIKRNRSKPAFRDLRNACTCWTNGTRTIDAAIIEPGFVFAPVREFVRLVRFVRAPRFGGTHATFDRLSRFASCAAVIRNFWPTIRTHVGPGTGTTLDRNCQRAIFVARAIGRRKPVADERIAAGIAGASGQPENDDGCAKPEKEGSR